ncbi:MAG: DUF1638 domain-containing protein [Eubacteriales bacterium]|nr:DUF1638 domain-containing protein [Eubacteriales bacterium]
MLRLKLIACKALYREFCLLTAACNNFVDVTYLKQGLHDTPKLLNQALQHEIDKIDSGDDIYSYYPRFGRDFYAILLGYGLCSNGIIGLRSKKYQLVTPKTDDCIGLLLGSSRRYKDYFAQHPGTYWYTPSWIENAYTPSEEMKNRLLKEYTEKYGEDNAKYLVETELMLKNYKRAAFVAWDELPFIEHEQYAKRAAEYFGWEYDRIKGETGMLEDFIGGRWDERFLVIPPGKMIEADYEGNIIRTAQ